MKPEPLKNKEHWGLIDVEWHRVFIKSDVKMAVQGLLEEIEKKADVSELFEESETVVSLSDVKSLIKKWLKAVE